MRKLISVAVSLVILVVIYWKIDVRRLVQVFAHSDGWWLAISLGMVVPLTMLTAWRFQQLIPREVRLRFGEAVRLILVAGVLNMLLPSKMGDIAKAYFLTNGTRLDGSLSLSLVVFEKACDTLSLLAWCLMGLVFFRKSSWLFWLLMMGVGVGLLVGLWLLGSRRLANTLFLKGREVAPEQFVGKLERLQAAWGEMHTYFWGDMGRLSQLAVTSILIWFLHLLQIWLFIRALNAATPFLANLALAPLAILAGLLPLTFAGVGTRDTTLIVLYQPFLNAPTAAALGLLCTARYLLPAMGGLPFLGRYLRAVRGLRTESGAPGTRQENVEQNTAPESSTELSVK
jgi:uncharacterized protein (TIRG00374 family)